MKRFLALMLAALLVFGLAACGGGDDAAKEETQEPVEEVVETDEPTEPAEETSGEGYELALITDLGTIDDKSFNQGSWEGLEQYATEHNITYKYYQPTEQSDDAYLSAIELAVKGGAKVIVTPGFLFEVPIYIAQETYPDVHFILVDGTPHDEDFNERIDPNVVGLTYAEEQAGFLAGYAAVKDGYTKLGFMGGMAVPAVVRFGYGYVQGAEVAAEELGVDITMNYHYTGAFSASPEAQAMAASWYNDGVEVIFACGGAVGNSVMAAAEQADAKVIGVDVDQSGESPTVITSATKGLRVSVYDSIAGYYDGNFPGGQKLVYGADNDGVTLPMETSKFETFTQEDYDAVYAKLKDGSFDLIRDMDAEGNQVVVSDIPVERVTITEVD